MKSYCIIYFERRNDVTSVVKLHREYSPSASILYTKLDYACDVICMFKVNYTIAFHGISVKQNHSDLFMSPVFTASQPHNKPEASYDKPCSPQS